jgi:hypothetical protein
VGARTSLIETELGDYSSIVNDGNAIDKRIASSVRSPPKAGWRLSGRLEIPANITLLPLPPRSPELNPQENVWQFIRDNWLSNRTFAGYDDIVDHCCHAWNKLTDQPWRIMSIGLRDWMHRF